MAVSSRRKVNGKWVTIRDELGKYGGEKDEPKKKKKSSSSNNTIIDARKPITAAPINISQPTQQPQPTGIGALREQDTLAGKATKVLTSGKTTAVLGTVLAGLTLGPAVSSYMKGGSAAASSTGVITQTVTAAGRTATAQRAFVGQAAHQAPKYLNKIFSTVRPVAARYATNTKTMSLTKSLMGKAGMSLGAVSLLVGAIGSYPFAGFIKEEALQTLGFAFNTAQGNKDLQGMADAIEEQEEVLNGAKELMDKIPYANVLNQLKKFYEAAGIKLENDKRKFATLAQEQESGETAFQEERRVADEKSADRDLEKLKFESEYYKLIREKKFNEAEELLAAQGEQS